MSDGNTPSHQGASTAANRPALRKLIPEELAKIIEVHKQWLDSCGKTGACADLSNVDFQRQALPKPRIDFSHANFENSNLQYVQLNGAILTAANLSGADLKGANLNHTNLDGANLQKADLTDAKLEKAKLQKADFESSILNRAILKQAVLRDANLRGAQLRRVDFDSAEMTRAILREADLQNANLETANELLAGQLAGSDVTGAKLPKGIGEFDGLKGVAEATTGAQALFIAMLSACVYSWLTIATTKDVDLLTSVGSSELPIIKTAISIVGFYMTAPFLLLAVYVYFHLNLQRLWERLAELPAVLPDGRPLDYKADPWLLNGLVRAHFARLKTSRPPLSRAQEALVIILAWSFVPFTLICFWIRYLPRRDFLFSDIQFVLVVLSISAGIASYRLARATLCGGRKTSFPWLTPQLMVSSAVLAGLLSLTVFAYNPYAGPFSWLREIGVRPFLSIEGAAVSITPQNWTGQTNEFPLVKGAQLEHAQMAHAWANRSFFMKANLSGADLSKAFLMGTDLSSAELSSADLTGARLYDANLSGACLISAKLSKTDLSRSKLTGGNLSAADLTDADLSGADLSGASFFGAKLSGAKLIEADLSRANLSGADLSRANLSKAGLSDADIYRAILTGAKLSETKFIRANLTGADLTGADLFGSDLSGAKLSGAKLIKAKLIGAKLSESGLTLSGLIQANLNELAILEGKPAATNLRKDDLIGADLTGADLTEAIFSSNTVRNANFEKANLRGARFIDVDLKNAKGLTREQIKDAVMDDKTKASLPKDLQPSSK